MIHDVLFEGLMDLNGLIFMKLGQRTRGPAKQGVETFRSRQLLPLWNWLRDQVFTFHKFIVQMMARN